VGGTTNVNKGGSGSGGVNGASPSPTSGTGVTVPTSGSTSGGAGVTPSDPGNTTPASPDGVGQSPVDPGVWPGQEVQGATSPGVAPFGDHPPYPNVIIKPVFSDEVINNLMASANGDGGTEALPPASGFGPLGRTGGSAVILNETGAVSGVARTQNTAAAAITALIAAAALLL